MALLLRAQVGRVTLLRVSRAFSTHAAPQHDLVAAFALPAGASLPSEAYAFMCNRSKQPRPSDATWPVVHRDERQLRALSHLDSLHRRLLATSPPAGDPSHDPSLRAGGGLFGALFGSSSAPARPSATPHADVSGLYMFGGPGCGKTFLMDLFYVCLPPSARAVRLHTHAFMLSVHARMHSVRREGRRGDPLPALADELAATARVMCFDEVMVNDVGDAMIIRRLFEQLWARGMVLVATSNRHPRQLYANGLQRELFLPFIDMLEARCTVHNLESDTDYRLLHALEGSSTWMCPPHHYHAHGHARQHAAPPHSDVSARFEAAWQAAVPSTVTVTSHDLRAQGRNVHVPSCVLDRKIARFAFTDLCAKPLYSADYHAIAQTFGTLFISDVPRLTLAQRNEVRRFITLIDTLYEHRVKVCISAAATPVHLFTPTFGDEEDAPPPGAGPAAGAAAAAAAATAKNLYDEVFAWDRTVSRLTEMQSAEYIHSEWRPQIAAYVRSTDIE